LRREASDQISARSAGPALLIRDSLADLEREQALARRVDLIGMSQVTVVAVWLAEETHSSRL
jgi:hypothetical protein